MKDLTNTTNIREWVLDWFENQYGTTRECLENSERLSNVTCFDNVDRLFLECNVESDFGIAVLDGSFYDCDTIDEIVNVIKSLLDKDTQNATLAP